MWARSEKAESRRERQGERQVGKARAKADDDVLSAGRGGWEGGGVMQ